MQKQLGLKPPLTEYIFLQIESPIDPPPQLSAQILRDYVAYNDWANDRILTVSAGLSDEQLDRDFDFGMGSIRKTLAHLNSVNDWWMENWTTNSMKQFPELRGHEAR